MVLLNGRAMHEVEPTMEATQAEVEMLRQENAELREWRDAVLAAWGLPVEENQAGPLPL